MLDRTVVKTGFACKLLVDLECAVPRALPIGQSGSAPSVTAEGFRRRFGCCKALLAFSRHGRSGVTLDPTFPYESRSSC